MAGSAVPFKRFYLLLEFDVPISAKQIVAINSFIGIFLVWLTQKNVNSPASTANAITVALSAQPGQGAEVARVAEVKVPTSYGTGPGAVPGALSDTKTGTGDGT